MCKKSKKPLDVWQHRELLAPVKGVGRPPKPPPLTPVAYVRSHQSDTSDGYLCRKKKRKKPKSTWNRGVLAQLFNWKWSSKAQPVVVEVPDNPDKSVVSTVYEGGARSNLRPSTLKLNEIKTIPLTAMPTPAPQNKDQVPFVDTNYQQMDPDGDHLIPVSSTHLLNKKKRRPK